MNKLKFVLCLCGMLGLLLCSSMPVYATIQYHWDFGDGHTSTAEKPFHTYSKWGVYHWTLTVTRDGETCVRYGTICINQYEWNFGDGYTSDEQNPTHIYESPGVYQWNLTSTNCKGEECVVSGRSITIGNAVPTLTLTSLNGGEELFPFTTHNISWIASHIYPTLTLTLLKDGVELGTIGTGIHPRSSPFPWSVATYKDNNNELQTAFPASGYTIKIEEEDGPPIVSDTIDDCFSISGQSVITVTSPNGGETWLPGTIKNITWTASSVSNPVDIILLRSGVVKGTIAEDLDPLSAPYPWTVGNYIGGTAQAKSGYTIKVKENNTDTYDSSDNSFTIPSDPTITLTSPNGGEYWDPGSQRDITWNSSNISAPFRITLLKDGLPLGPIGEDIPPGETSFQWTVGNYGGGTAEEGPGYTIKIEAQGIFDIIDGPFTISDDPAIRVISPNGGETWSKGFLHYITWEAYNIRDSNFDIILWKNGVKLGTIAQDIPSTETSYLWYAGVYLGGTVSGLGYVIEIKESSTTVSDLSDSSFKIFENY